MCKLQYQAILPIVKPVGAYFLIVCYQLLFLWIIICNSDFNYWGTNLLYVFSTFNLYGRSTTLSNWRSWTLSPPIRVVLFDKFLQTTDLFLCRFSNYLCCLIGCRLKSKIIITIGGGLMLLMRIPCRSLLLRLSSRVLITNEINVVFIRPSQAHLRSLFRMILLDLSLR